MVASVLVELEAVEQDRPPLPQHDVAEVQIAMAVPDLAGGAPLLEQIAPPLELGAGAPVEILDRRRLEHAVGQPAEILGIAVDHLAHAGVAAAIRCAPRPSRGSAAIASASRSIVAASSAPRSASRSSSAS